MDIIEIKEKQPIQILKQDKLSYFMKKTANPIFLCGFPSGGTDLLKNILNVHDSIYINGEMPFLYGLPSKGYDHKTVLKDEESLSKILALLRKEDVWNNLENINSPSILLPITLPELLKETFSNKNNYIWGNKTPQNSEHIPHLLQIFPNARFIIILRDVRDIALSWRKKWGKDMLLCAHKWHTRMSIMYKDFEFLDKNKYFLLKYENMLNNNEIEMRKVINFLDLEWDGKILEYQKHITETRDGKINYGRPLIKNNQQKWQGDIPQHLIKRIEEVTYPSLIKFSYLASTARDHVPIKSNEKIRGHLKDAFSLFFVGNRFRKNQNFLDIYKDIIFEIKKRFKLFP